MTDLNKSLDEYRRSIVAETLQSVLEKFTELLRANGFTGAVKRVGRARLKKIARRKRARKTCPHKSCKNVFAPRFGGYCKEHRNTAGFKAWKAKRGDAKTSVKKPRGKKAA